MVSGPSVRFWLAAAASLISHPVLAQQWVEYTQTAEFRAFVDMDSIKPDGELLRAWEKLEYTLSQRDAQGKRYRTTLGDWAINCQQRTSALTALGYKTGDEAIWFNRQPRPQWEFAAYPAGSPGDRFIEMVCANPSAPQPEAADQQQSTKRLPNEASTTQHN